MIANARDFGLAFAFKIRKAFQRLFRKLAFGRRGLRGGHQARFSKVIGSGPRLIILLVSPFFAKPPLRHLQSHPTRPILLNHTGIRRVGHGSGRREAPELGVAEVVDALGGSGKGAQGRLGKCPWREGEE